MVDLSSRKEENWSSLIPEDLSCLILDTFLIREEGGKGKKKRKTKSFDVHLIFDVKCVQNNQLKGKKFTGYGHITDISLRSFLPHSIL